MTSFQITTSLNHESMVINDMNYHNFDSKIQELRIPYR